MSTDFRVAFKGHNGNLHAYPCGNFDGSSAFQLIWLLNKKYDGKSEVIIDTSKLRNILSFGSNTFKRNLNLSRIPKDRLSFMGEKGCDLAPEGCKVIGISKKDR